MMDEERLEGIKNVKNQNYSTALATAGRTNSIRWALRTWLEDSTGLPVGTSAACNTKANRIRLRLEKDHCLDAACVGSSVPKVLHFKTEKCLVIKTCGRGKHCRTNVTDSGFPKGYLPRRKNFFGFQTGYMVVANVPSGKKEGQYVGRVACRSTGSFKITTQVGKIDGINHRYMKAVQRHDGYSYSEKTVNLYAHA